MIHEHSVEELEILKFLVKNRNYYEKYFTLVEPYITSRDFKTLFGAVDAYYKTAPDHSYIAEDDFKFFVKNNYPHARNYELLEMAIDMVYLLEVSSDTIRSYIHKLIEGDLYKQVADICTDATITKTFNRWEDVEKRISDFRVLLKDNEETPFVEFDFDKFVDATRAEKGWNWRLNCLNEDIGPLLPETLGHIFARPETGKTTFLSSEVTHFASQLDAGECILWINNEQAIGKVWQRCISSVIGAPYQKAEANPEWAKQILHEANFKAIKFIDGAYLSYEYIHTLAKDYKPRIIVIDQGDKLHFRGDTTFDGPARLKELYRKLRELAKETGAAIITVGQASGEAEGKKWLTMDMMDNSKVGKPGEMDYIIGIGHTNKEDDEWTRYIHIAKNKLLGKHGKHSVAFDGENARYIDE